MAFNCETIFSFADGKAGVKKLKIKHPKHNKQQLENIIDTFFQSIKNALRERKTVELRGFGSFFLKQIKEKH